MNIGQNKAPELSVIMANYNGADFLGDAVEAVLTQSFGNLELIVSDDGSSDESLSVLAAISDPRLRVVEAQSNAGPGAARNRALDVARGKWIAVVDADDLMHRDRFQTMLKAGRGSDVAIIADNQLFFGREVDAGGERLFDAPDGALDITTETLLEKVFMGRENRLGYLKPLIRRDALGDVRYRTDMRVGEDFDLLLRLTIAGHDMRLLPDALYHYRRREGSTSHRLKPEDAARMTGALEDLRDANAHLANLIDERMSGLRGSIAFETLASDLKAGRIAKAGLGVMLRPGLAVSLGKVAARKVLAKSPPVSTPSVAPEPSPPMVTAANRKVHIRVPTYKRPEQLRRALEGLQQQSFSDWVCDVFDDDPDQSGKGVVVDLGDPRIVYHANPQNLGASQNIDQCFTRQNPHGAGYFCVLEDDNQILPNHLEENIRVIESERVQIVLRNQLVEFGSGTGDARLSETGLLETKFVEGYYSPERFHLSLIADMGVSNGGLFWSSEAISNLEIGAPVSATLQEYLRTFAIVEPVYVAMTPTAVWAENSEQTTRDLGETAGWFRRELALKRSVQILQREIWDKADRDAQSDFVDGSGFGYPAEMRASGLVKSHARLFVGKALSPGKALRLALRGAMIRTIGRPEPGFRQFLEKKRVQAG